ncbi:MAG: hypothetical protein JKY37_04915 [Nannocystaceae bacterium]|nr:hypothetical protein [Nannocystaceae bacterium]
MTDVLSSDAPVGESDQSAETASGAYAHSLREVMIGVISALPDHATLGELIAAAKSNPAMSPVLEIFTVQELIDATKSRPKVTDKPAPKAAKAVQVDDEGNPIMELDAGPRVIRRRADVPDGDLLVLKVLAERGPQRESDLANSATLTGEQLRIILRSLRTKGHVHVEGSGIKRRLKITRHGSGYLRKSS